MSLRSKALDSNPGVGRVTQFIADVAEFGFFVGLVGAALTVIGLGVAFAVGGLSVVTALPFINVFVGLLVSALGMVILALLIEFWQRTREPDEEPEEEPEQQQPARRVQ